MNLGSSYRNSAPAASAGLQESLRLPPMRELHSLAGFRVRSATRADCPSCRGRSRATVSFTGDSRIVSIKSARLDFRRAFGHLLKYVGKPAGNDPKHLARLEAAFSGVRRVHTLGLFYNSDLPDEDELTLGEESDCPYCRSHLFVVGAYCPVAELEASGLPDLEAARREMAWRRVFDRAGP